MFRDLADRKVRTIHKSVFTLISHLGGRCGFKLAPLVDWSTHRATPPSAVNSGERHVRVLKISSSTKSFHCDHRFCIFHLVLNLDIFALVLEVDPCVGVAPDKDCEEECANAR